MKELLMLSLALLGWIRTTEETEPIQITKTNYTNIFLPEGEIIPKADFATLKILVNVTSIFDESNEVCLISDVIDSFVKKRTKKISCNLYDINKYSILNRFTFHNNEKKYIIISCCYIWVIL